MALIDHTSAVIYMRDVDGQYLLVNREYERLFSVRREDIVGLTDHDLFQGRDRRRVPGQRPGGDRPGRASSDGGAGAGRRRPAHVRHGEVPADGRDGTPYAICGISTDITDRKRAEEEVRRLNAELEDAGPERTAELEASNRELEAFATRSRTTCARRCARIDGFSQALLEDYARRAWTRRASDYLGADPRRTPAHGAS